MLACAGVTGKPAAALAKQYRRVIDIPWETALTVFSGRDVPRYVGLCRAKIGPEFDALHPHCKGALFSIAMNRGPSFDSKGTRYAEMRDIKAAVRSGDLARVPGLIKSMKRLWQNDPDAKGLLTRRDAEAALWVKGLAQSHPDEHVKLDDVHAPANPETVEFVQRALKNKGYYQVGAIDGNLTPKGKTADAILAFRNRNGLPLVPTIDDDLLRALGTSGPAEVSEERATATVQDLRETGSKTIDLTDTAKRLGGNLFGTGSILTGLTGAGALAKIQEHAVAAKGAKDALVDLGITPGLLLGVAGAAVAVIIAGLGIWFVAHAIEQIRLSDHRSGKNP
jgi:hypothetical protein